MYLTSLHDNVLASRAFKGALVVIRTVRLDCNGHVDCPQLSQRGIASNRGYGDEFDFPHNGNVTLLPNSAPGQCQ